MTQDIALGAFRAGGLNLQDFARHMCRPAWEAWKRAEKELAVVGGRPSIAHQLAGGSSREIVGWAMPPESSKASEREAQKRRVLENAVCDGIKSPMFALTGIPKGGHEETKIARVLVDNLR